MYDVRVSGAGLAEDRHVLFGKDLDPLAAAALARLVGVQVGVPVDGVDQDVLAPDLDAAGRVGRVAGAEAVVAVIGRAVRCRVATAGNRLDLPEDRDLAALEVDEVGAGITAAARHLAGVGDRQPAACGDVDVAAVEPLRRTGARRARVDSRLDEPVDVGRAPGGDQDLAALRAVPVGLDLGSVLHLEGTRGRRGRSKAADGDRDVARLAPRAAADVVARRDPRSRGAAHHRQRVADVDGDRGAGAGAEVVLGQDRRAGLHVHAAADVDLDRTGAGARRGRRIVAGDRSARGDRQIAVDGQDAVRGRTVVLRRAVQARKCVRSHDRLIRREGRAGPERREQRARQDRDQEGLTPQHQLHSLYWVKAVRRGISSPPFVLEKLQPAGPRALGLTETTV